MKYSQALIFGASILYTLLTGNSFANTISDTYATAVLEPYKFESILTNEVNVNPSYYNNFFACSTLTRRSLQQSINQLRQEVMVSSGQRIQYLNKQITETIEFLREITWLEDVIRRHRNNERNFYLQTELARSAIYLIGFAQSWGADVRSLRRGRITALELIPCH